MEPYLLSATEALGRFKDGSLTVEAYAKSLLSRIEKRDEAVQAWTHLDPEYVIKEAKRLDQIRPEDRGPLHGISVGVKDIIYTKDMPTQQGSPVYQSSFPEVDAGSVRILRAAGALLLGKTATTPFATAQHGPATRNPHDPTRTPGGSSSGSGAAVGDFQVAVALGTQTGGSTIRPGSFNGTYAFKPTWNSITREGHRIHSLILDTIGFFARTVEDLELLAEVFALADDTPPTAAIPVKGAKFGIMKTMVWSQAGAGTIAALEKAAELLKAHGAKVEEITLTAEFDPLPRWHKVIFDVDAGPALLPEYRSAKDKLQQYLIDHVENGFKISRADTLEAFDGVAALRPKMDEVLGKYAAIITPSVPDEPPVGQHATGSPAFNGIWTVLHTPVLNVPGFKGENGLPIGLSLVAPRYRDQHLLAVSREVGRIFESEGGWKRSLDV